MVFHLRPAPRCPPHAARAGPGIHARHAWHPAGIGAERQGRRLCQRPSAREAWRGSPGVLCQPYTVQMRVVMPQVHGTSRTCGRWQMEVADLFKPSIASIALLWRPALLCCLPADGCGQVGYERSRADDAAGIPARPQGCCRVVAGRELHHPEHAQLGSGQAACLAPFGIACWQGWVAGFICFYGGSACSLLKHPLRSRPGRLRWF
jgi:hypothetical protein